MELNWSLKELYSSFECNEFKEDLNKLDELIENFITTTNNIIDSTDSPDKLLENFISMNIELKTLARKLGSMVHLTLSVDTKNSTALKYDDILSSKISNLAESEAKITKWIGNLKDLDKIIQGSRLLSEHNFFLKEKAKNAKYMLSDKEEAIIAKMKNTGSDAWCKLKNVLTSGLMVDIELYGENKQLPLSMIRNMAYDADSTIRRKAYDAEIKAYEKIHDGMAAAINGIKGEVITLCDMRGFPSPLDKTLFNSRMDRKILDSMLDAIKEYLPIFRKYLKRKGELLGHKNGLPFYDLFAPMGNADMTYTYEDGCKCVIDNFRTFSDDLADFAKNAMEKSWIDVLPKEGKVGGAFCSRLPHVGESRVLLNYGNAFSDVVTLSHELGHGYHGYCLNNESILNAHYPMPIAETASNFCETIVKKAAIKTATKDEAFSILETEISDCTQVIVDIYSRFLFESELFKIRKERSLSVKDLNEIMINAQKEAYGDGLDSNFLHPYMWACKTHYYYAENNFYNFPYAFGQLFAKGLYAEYLKRGDSFPEQYKTLLSATGKNSLSDIAKIMNIDISAKDFWITSLKMIEEDINLFLKYNS
ncbi:oligoendopeptidase F [Clostridium sulfidigenes]|uniref:Oligoendopeptidase F n=1 Tax=Clostridium sulfidigenes TaxID=318464 RepID=A0A084JCM7_9CLOT|nr:M3 family oligoendopeptidase [Clostridium sulfidigenes]KEZ86711.1 oligoendopeptidase F [Clostridium sulfidigenes]